MNTTKDQQQFTGVACLAGQTHRFSTAIKGMLLCVSLGLMLTACGGGKDSQRAPDGNKPGEELGASAQAAKNTDIQAFENTVWKELRSSGKGCGNCHRPDANSPQQPYFAHNDVNEAYNVVVTKGLAITSAPASSKLVSKVGPPTGHNCWATPEQCAADMTAYITAWANGYVKGPASREVKLSPIPEAQQKTVGDLLLFPTAAPSKYLAVYTLLTTYCSECHISGPGDPLFAVANQQDSYIAAKSKINLNTPAESGFVHKLLLNHHCWDGDCNKSAAEMQTAIQGMADAIRDAPDRPSLDHGNIIISKALTLLDGVQSSGGNRYESNQIALYEFKSRSGDTVLDNSGVQPPINLTLYGREGIDYRWLSNWGVEFLTPMGRAQGNTTSSKKIHNLVKLSGQYSIEAWVIPGNVTQMGANIISYSFGEGAGNTFLKNFTLGQTMYNYDFYHRSSTTGTGDAPLSTLDAAQILQANLQHVVVTYDALNGRKIYVNGQLVATGNETDKGGDLLNWHDSYALVLGNDTDSKRPWQGTLRMVAIHDRTLTPEQIQLNYAAEVGQKYLMPFAVSHVTGMPPESYIVFEVSQYDEYSYLFSKPRYVNLAGNTPSDINLAGMRIGLNGDEVHVGQAYPNISASDPAKGYSDSKGQAVLPVDTIIGLQNGAESDEFFLTFERLGGRTRLTAYDENDVLPVPGTPPALPVMTGDTMSPDIGVRTFNEINATMAKLTQMSNWVGVPKINDTYILYKQQFPAVENIEGFSASQQMAIAQLALSYCNARIDRDIPLDMASPNRYFQGFDFNATPSVAFGTVGKVDGFINPLLAAVMNSASNLATQPDVPTVRQEMYKLIITGDTFSYTDTLGHTKDINVPRVPLLNNPDNTAARTKQIATAACAAILGSAAMLIQ